mgnify:FL=1
MRPKKGGFNRRTPEPRRTCEHCGRSSSRCECGRYDDSPLGWGEELAVAKPPRVDREMLRSLGL